MGEKETLQELVLDQCKFKQTNKLLSKMCAMYNRNQGAESLKEHCRTRKHAEPFGTKLPHKEKFKN